MHLEGLVTHFQKMVLFIMLWFAALEILVFEIEEFFKFFSAVSASFMIF